MMIRTILLLVFMTNFPVYLAGCGELPLGLDEYCPDDPLIRDCPEGDCGPYPCLSYCVRYFPESEGIPERGMGEWCDDIPVDFDFGAFCEENGQVIGCAEWCVNHPARCDSSICGDDACTGQEWAASCPDDCPALCGDDACTHDESAFNCQPDCEAVCGDHACTGEETHEDCPDDCPPDCGDHLCGDNESPISCPIDCPPVCGDGECTHDENASSCLDDCEALCGDHHCSIGENALSCPVDCDADCGDQFCTESESSSTCPADCPAECGDEQVTHDELCEGDETHWCDTTCGSEGTLSCVNCIWGELCEPPDEVCNGLDDDCIDGPDNGFECAQASQGECESSCGSIGTWICDHDCQWPESCTPPDEVCNGFDDDCDGLEDNGFECIQGAEGECTTSCNSTGTTTCGADCEWNDTCQIPEEACNGLDDDCDEIIDESCSCLTDWSFEALPFAGYLTVADIEGSSWDHIIAAANNDAVGLFLLFNGSTWSVMASTTSIITTDLHIASDGSGVAVGLDGAIASYDGISWSEVDSPTSNTLIGVDSSYAVGSNGTILHRQDDRWSLMDCPDDVQSEHLNDIRVVGAIAVAVGTNGVILRYDGQWQEVESNVTSDLVSIAAIGSHFIAVGDAGVIVYSSNGIDWHSVSSPVSWGLTGVWATPYNTAEAEVFISGSRQTILRHVGRVGAVSIPPEFSIISGMIASQMTYTSLWGSLFVPGTKAPRNSSTDNVYVGTLGGVFHRCGDRW